MLKGMVLTAWFIVQSVAIQKTGEYQYLFVEPINNYNIEYSSRVKLEFKEGYWYKLKLDIACTKVDTIEYFDTGVRVIPLETLSYFCSANEVSHEKPNIYNCFYVNGVCYY